MISDLTRGVKTFDGMGGHEVAADWLEDIRVLAIRQSWEDLILLDVAKQHLSDSALKWYRYHKFDIQS